MSTRYEISGSKEFSLLAVRLRAAEADLTVHMRRAVDKAARPMPVAARRSALSNLPHRGGLNVLVARARITVRRVSATTLEIHAKGIEQLGNTNEGFVSHPTYGRSPYGLQSIPRARDWFYEPLRRRKRQVADELGDAMHRTAKEIM
jgi:hypothetical protein